MTATSSAASYPGRATLQANSGPALTPKITKKKSILFVDDDPVALNLIQEQFRSVFGNALKYERASSALEAEEIILEELANGNLPALIVSDWMMPGKRGDQFLTEIRTAYPEIGLVLHSGMADNHTIQEVDASANLLCALPKPWDGKRNIDKIFQALAR